MKLYKATFGRHIRHGGYNRVGFNDMCFLGKEVPRWFSITSEGKITMLHKDSGLYADSIVVEITEHQKDMMLSSNYDDRKLIFDILYNKIDEEYRRKHTKDNTQNLAKTSKITVW